MCPANCVTAAKGEFLRKDSVAPGFELVLFRNDGLDEVFEIFEIGIMTQGDIFFLPRHQCDKNEAIKRYEEMLKKLKNAKKG